MARVVPCSTVASAGNNLAHPYFFVILSHQATLSLVLLYFGPMSSIVSHTKVNEEEDEEDGNWITH